MAAHAIGDGKYRQALDYYRLALDEYLNGSPTVVELVNAAATCFNLGALSKKLQNYPQAAAYFCQAEELYKSCSKKVRRAPSSESTMDASSAVCLFQLIVETLQARAHLNFKYQNCLDEAIECHEEVVDVLEQQIENDRDVVYFKIHFTRLSKEDRRQLLITSLQSLGKFYVERGEFEDGLVAYQEALAVTKEQHSDTMPTLQRQGELKQIIRALSDIYMKKNSSTIKVPQLQRHARLQEDLGNLEGALGCWEKVLYLESQACGEISVQVANALCQIARVFTAQGNREGALDLYQAAIAKYRQTGEPLSREAVGNTTNIFCQLRLHEDALDYMDDLLLDVQSQEEEAWILCQRGRIYLELGRLYEASQDLCQSAEMCDSDDDYVFKLLQKLEFLEQRVEVSESATSSADLAMPLQCIAEDDEDSTTTLEQATVDHARKTATQTLETVHEQRNEEVVILLDNGNTGQAAEESSGSGRAEKSRYSEVDDRFLMGDVGDSTEDESSLHEGPLQDEFDEDTLVLALTNSSTVHQKVEGNSRQPCQENGSKTMKETEGAITQRVPASAKSAALLASDRNSRTQENALPAGLKPEENTIDTTDERSEKSSPLPDSMQPECRDRNQQDQEPGTSSLAASVVETNEEGTGMFSGNTEQAVLETSPDPKCGDEMVSVPVSPKSTNCVPLGKEEGSSHSLRPPLSISSPRSQHESVKRELPETSLAPKAPNRGFFANLASPFRRTRSRSPFRRTRSKNQLIAAGLDALDEDKEIKDFPAEPDRMKVKEDLSGSFDEAPVTYIVPDDDDRSEVSQLTFKVESFTPQKSNQDSQWWWGVTAEGLEGWFPTSYVHQAVEAAEGFLSAKSIHQRGKSRPLDYESDEETAASERGAPPPAKSEEQGLPDQPETTKSNSQPGARVSIGSSVRPCAGSESARSTPSRTTSVVLQIEQKEAQLEKFRAGNTQQQAAKAEMLFELAVLRSKNDQIGEALKTSQQALNIQKASNNLTAACKTLHFMAEMNSKAKHYKAALACYAEAQTIQEALYGYYHEEIANTLNRQGNVLARQGEFDLAMENHKEALRILKECCGEEVKNPLVSQTLIQIGAVYYKERNSLKTIQNRDGYRTFIEAGMLEVIGRAHEERGSYRMAIAFFEEKLQCLDDDENSSDRAQVAETLNSLGILSCRAGLYLEAIDYYDRALGIQMKVGCDDVQLAMAKVLAGSVQYSLGHFHKALKLFEDALHALRGKIGKDQETVAATLFHMGVVRSALCDFENAMSNLTDALGIQKKLLGNDHPATLRTRREIGNLYAAWLGDLESAVKEYSAVLEIQKRIHGERHPNVAETLHCVGCIQAKGGDQAAALSTLEDCYNMRIEFLGLDHPLQATTLHEIAKIRLQRGSLKKAIHICDSVLHIRKDSLSENHVDVATATATKASCLVARGDFNEANRLFLEACSIAKEAVGENHPVVADIHVQIGTMHLRKCHFEEASTAVNKALEIYRTAGLNEDHRGFQDALKELERVERAEMLCV